jgi:putative tricarboxylic transport membrane protein
MKRADTGLSLILVLFGGLFCVSSLSLGTGTVKSPGPGFMPFVAGCVLILFSFGIIFEGRHVKRAEGRFKGRRSAIALLVLVCLFVYALVLDMLGFLLATFLLLVLLFGISEQRRWRVIVGRSVFITVLAYLLFDYTLKITLPIGFLGF